MARLTASTILSALVTSLATKEFTNFELAHIFKGFDPRRIAANNEFPFAVASIHSTFMGEALIGGSCMFIHNVSIVVLFKYSDAEDPNEKKIVIAQELFDWLCDNKVSASVYAVSFDSGTGGAPTIEYDTEEERIFSLDDTVMGVKVSFHVMQPSYVSIN